MTKEHSVNGYGVYPRYTPRPGFGVFSFAADGHRLALLYECDAFGDAEQFLSGINDPGVDKTRWWVL